MLTVFPSAESGGQSVRNVGLQLDHVCAVEGTMSTAEARAASACTAERIFGSDATGSASRGRIV